MNDGSAAPKTRVLFVCMGNICRSPTAEAVFRARVRWAGLHNRIIIDSAGTHGCEGAAPDARAMSAARRRGYDLSNIRSRQLVPQDFERFDYLLGMDDYNVEALVLMKPHGFTGYVGRLLDFAPHLGVHEIDDPYYGGPAHFDAVLNHIEAASDGLLARIRERIDSPATAGK